MRIQRRLMKMTKMRAIASDRRRERKEMQGKKHGRSGKKRQIERQKESALQRNFFISNVRKEEK